jgi:hypothetical protein
MVDIRQKALNAKDVPAEVVTVPEWDDVKIEVRGFTVQERLDFYNRVADGDQVNRENFLPELVISCCFDPDSGQKVFEPADRDMLKTKSAAAIERITAVATRLSGLGEADVKTAEVDLGETPTDGS